MSKPQASFINRFYTANLGGLISPYGSIMDKKVTPALVVMATNNKLPSFERGAKYNRAQEMIRALNPLNAMRNYTYMDWIGGFGIIPLLNVLQLGLTSGLEIGFRTAGLFLTRPANTFLNWIILDEKKSTAAKIFAGACTALLSPFWCIGQALTLVADVFSYTRSLLDSAMYLVNPLWWMSVAGILPGDKAPSFRFVAKTFLTSLLQLVPAALIIAAAVMTGGASLPATHAVSGPLAALAPTITTAFTTAWTAITTHTVMGIFMAGAISVASKFFSACVGEVSRRLTDDNKFAKEADSTGKQKKSGTHHSSDFEIAKRARYTLTDHPHDHYDSIELTRRSSSEALRKISTTPSLEIHHEDNDTEREGMRPSRH